MLKKLLLGVVVVFVVLIVAAALNPSPKPAAVPTQAPAQAAAAQPTSAPATAAAPKPTAVAPTAKPAPTWQQVAKFEGKSIKDTETFTITADEWRISWDTKPGDMGKMNFQIYVYKAPKTMVAVAANVIGEDKDSSVQRGKGDYYLTINTAQPYTVVIEQRQ